MRAAFALLFAISCLVVASPAVAEPKDKCNGADGIAPALVEACNQAAYDRCRPSYQPRCINGVIKDFQVQTKEQGKQGQRDQAATGEKVCDSDDFVQACTKALDYSKSVCMHQGSLAGEQDSGRLAAWRAVFAKAPEAKAYWAAFAPKYPQCNLSRFACSFSEFDSQACEQVEDKFRAKWGEFREALMQRVELAKDDVKTLARNPFDWAAAATFDRLATDLQEASKFAEIAYLNVDAAELAGWSKWIGEEKVKWQANREKALANVKCPVATNKDGALTAKLRKVLDEHLSTTRNPESTMVETVRSFGLLGSAEQSHQQLPPVTFEDQGSFACVRQDKEGTTTCRILKFTFRRSKPAGSGWSEWGFYSVGGGEEMSCKNLK